MTTAASKLPDHLFVASDGDLFDTRNAKWSQSVLRRAYSYTHREIKTVAQYKATLRNGAFAWPGGYPLFLLCDDGGALCFACGRKEARNIITAIRDKDHSGWRVVACDINYDRDVFCCDNCAQRIDGAYVE